MKYIWRVQHAFRITQKYYFFFFAFSSGFFAFSSGFFALSNLDFFCKKFTNLIALVTIGNYCNNDCINPPSNKSSSTRLIYISWLPFPGHQVEFLPIRGCLEPFRPQCIAHAGLQLCFLPGSPVGLGEKLLQGRPKISLSQGLWMVLRMDGFYLSNIMLLEDNHKWKGWTIDHKYN
jgi:hypothetical protein